MARYPRDPDLDHDGGRYAADKQPASAIYEYLDEEGRKLFRVLRFDKPKKFLQERLDGESWIPGLKGTRRVPWNLPHLVKTARAGGVVHLCEGEKDAGRLLTELANAGREGEVATTTPGGARAWRAGYALYFAGAQVIVHPDRDEEGERYLRDAAASLLPFAASVRVQRPRAGKDVSDHLDAGHGLDDFEEVPVEQASPAHALARALETSEIGEMLRSEPPEREWVVSGLIPKGVVGLVVAQGGAGKSHLSIKLALELALGGPFGPFAVSEPAGTIIVSAEDDRLEMHRRLTAARRARGGIGAGQLGDLARRVRMVDATGLGARVDMPELADGLAELAAKVEGCRLIILDPLSRLLPEEAELNSQETAGRIHNALDAIARRTGCAVLVLHHVGKLAQQRGAELQQTAATGSAQLVDLARLAINLRPLNAAEAEALGLERVANLFLQLAVSKSNYAVPPADPVVFRRADGGALVYQELPSAEDREAANLERHRAALVGVVRTMGRPVTRTEVEGAAGGVVPRGRVRAGWDALVANGTLVREGRRWALAGGEAVPQGELGFVPLAAVSGAVH
jgi:RecA-family ATPase